jgi:hypothetical protein
MDNYTNNQEVTLDDEENSTTFDKSIKLPAIIQSIRLCIGCNPDFKPPPMADDVYYEEYLDGMLVDKKYKFPDDLWNEKPNAE